MMIFISQYIKSYFTTKQNNMSKISSTDNKPTYTTIYVFQAKLDKNLLAVLCDTYLLGFWPLAITATKFTTLNVSAFFVAPYRSWSKPHPTNIIQKIDGPRESALPVPCSQEHVNFYITKQKIQEI